jgi:hypothetical protein
MDSTANDFYFTAVQLEIGDKATAFERRPYALERNLCLYYAYRWIAEDTSRYIANLQAIASDTAFGKMLDLPVPMRVVPTVNISASTDFRLSLPGSGTAGNCSSLTFTQNTKQSIAVVAAGVSGLTAGYCSVLIATNGAYVHCDAEL